MSPEQIRGQRPAPSMDIYSLGIICYECLNGRVPFYTGDLTYQILKEEPLPIEKIPKGIFAALKQCLAKDAKQRPGTAYQLVCLLRGKNKPEKKQKAGSQFTIASNVMQGVKEKDHLKFEISKLQAFYNEFENIKVPVKFKKSFAAKIGCQANVAHLLLKAGFQAMCKVLEETQVLPGKWNLAFSVGDFGKFCVLERDGQKTVVFREAAQSRQLDAVINHLSDYGVLSGKELILIISELLKKTTKKEKRLTITGVGSFTYSVKYGRKQLWFKPSARLKSLLSSGYKSKRKPQKRCNWCNKIITTENYYICQKCNKVFHSKGACIKVGFLFNPVCRICGKKLKMGKLNS
jgi:serine/threonine protein kinase